MAGRRREAYSFCMKHNKHTHALDPSPAASIKPAALAPVSQDEINFVPSPDEVARRAYFSYVNQGSSPGHEVQHWLAAEAELISERNRTRTHGYHNQT